MDHLVLVAAGWGLVASFVNEFIKQDSWPKWVNTVIADAVICLTATLTAWQVAPALNVHTFVEALFGAGVSAIAAYHGFLKPTGIGPAIQRETSFRAAPALPPA